MFEETIEFYCEDKVMVVNAGEIVFLLQGQPHAFFIRSPQVRALLMVHAVGEHIVGLDRDRYLMTMGTPATSMELPANPIVERIDDPNHSIRVSAANGIRFLSPEQTAKELPHYLGLEVKR